MTESLGIVLLVNLLNILWLYPRADLVLCKEDFHHQRMVLYSPFPWDSWVEEFKLANMLGIRNIEWTIDSDNLSFNPIALNSKLKEIKELSISNEIQYKSVTGDFLMQDPFGRLI